MSGCELHEVNISALLDGELEPEAWLPLLDHLTRCPRCRAFYESARQLETLAAHCPGALPLSGSSPDRPAASAAPPTRPRASAGPTGAWRRLFRPPAWAWAAAALLLVAIGFSSGLLVRTLPQFEMPSPETPVAITLGERPEGMDQERFIALTIELLQADPSYHREMLRVLRQVQPTQQNDELVPLFASNLAPTDHVRTTSIEDPSEQRGPAERPPRGIE